MEGANFLGRAAVSLPLMGIGNQTGGVVGLRLPGRLITPHGDRKPAGGGALERPSGGLITPHGDRKPACRPCSSGGASPSLPLMGIGNAEAEKITKVKNMLLITPHGDRKPTLSEYQNRQRGASLPLMGIGNPRCAPMRTSRTTAHYPSWGSETRRHLRRAAWPPPPHYPSWGSETRWRPGQSAPAGRPHYPSWGSETLVDENIMTGNQFRLITPHGDRKPRKTLQSAGKGDNSLPLMGIGNQV